MKKLGLAFNFAWLFAIIAGSVIIFIAIYATSSIVDTSRTEQDTKIAAELGIILNPIETNLEDSKYAIISFPDETRIVNTCRDTGNFGRQLISTSVRAGIGNEFQEPLVENYFFNKYIFSERNEQGEKLYVLVKNFEMPYKVASLIFGTTQNFCFVNPSSDIEDDITGLGAENMMVVDDEDDCAVGSEIVCFGQIGGNCDVEVDLIRKSVEKDGNAVFYEGPLIYGAIFSDAVTYECQVRRLMKRTGELAYLYADKTEFLTSRGCSSGLSDELRNFAMLSQIENGETSFKLNQIAQSAEELENRNDRLICKLF